LLLMWSSALPRTTDPKNCFSISCPSAVATMPY
jgi:hypothetical protein